MKHHDMTLHYSLQQLDLHGAVDYIQAMIRQEPSRYEHRWALFQMLCVFGQWEKALRQLQVCARIRPEANKQAYTMRTLIQCEVLREKVFLGQANPGYLLQSFSWMKHLIQANQLNLQGEVAAADNERYLAFEHLVDQPGYLNRTMFQRICDQDTRLGPVIEFYSAGGYRWGAWQDLQSLEGENPVHLIDLVWRKVKGTLADGTTFYAYMPVRYPIMPGTSLSAAALLARETVWTEEGGTLISGIGQKIWMTEQEQWPVLQCQQIQLIHERENV